jgi:hypothetical protein
MIKMKLKTKKYPIIYERFELYKNNGKIEKVDLTKTINNNVEKITGNINGKRINISKKVKFPPNLISPKLGRKTSMPNSFVPMSILKNKTKKHKKRNKTHIISNI